MTHIKFKVIIVYDYLPQSFFSHLLNLKNFCSFTFFVFIKIQGNYGSELGWDHIITIEFDYRPYMKRKLFQVMFRVISL